LGGDLKAPGGVVRPGVLTACRLGDDHALAQIPETPAGRRLALARWIASPENPLTARVIVNRIWQYHFGKGLVETPNNLGAMGKQPTHPYLLDWLAWKFVERGWSIKEMHRVSAAYQRSSRHPAADKLAETDPGNDLLAYSSPRRLEAEVIRDSMLAVAGELSHDTGGPGTFPEINDDVATQPLHIMGTLAPAYRPSAWKRERNRRTVYTYQKRNLADPFIEVFNGPPMSESCERRRPSTVPTQAFALFNSRFAHDTALAFAVRLYKTADGPAGWIDEAFHRALQRSPAGAERTRILAHWRRQLEHHRRAEPPPKPGRRPLVRGITSELTGAEVQIAEEAETSGYESNIHASEVPPEVRALADVALVLFNTNEFVYVN
jgi:hypothetical protein